VAGHGKERQCRLDDARYGKERRGESRMGQALQVRQGMVGHRRDSHAVARLGMGWQARHGMARRGRDRYGKA